MNRLGKVAVALAMALVTVESFGARLPVGYREVEWIGSTGQQSINLGFAPDKDKTGLVMSFNSGTYTDTTAFFCTGWGGDRYLLCQMSKKYMFFGSGNSVADACPGCDLTLTIVPDGTGNGTLTIDKPDDPEWKPTPATVGLSCSGNLQIFGAGGGHMSTFRLYRLTITERTVTPAGEVGGEDAVTQRVVHDYYPCYREADGEIGLYDVLAADPVSAFKADANKAATKFEKGEPVRGQDGLAVLGTPEDFGEVTPAYGTTDGHAAGESFVCSAPALYTNAERTVTYACRGYTVYTNGIEYVSGTENCFTYTHPDCAGGAMLVWQWELAQYKLDVDVAGDGTVDFESQFVAAGEIVTVTATPNDGWAFWRWEGTAAEGSSQRYAKSISVSVDKAKTLTARFSELAQLPKTLYVSPGGAGTKDGTSWENASDDLDATYNYAAIGASADNPREVRLAAGLYMITAPIEMKPYVHVIGATDGETILCGDQGKADYWRNYLSGNLGNVIQDGKVYLPDYPADPYMCIAAAEEGTDTEHAFACTTVDAPANVFRNLTFTLFEKAAIFSEGASVEGLVVDNCKFYANNILIVKSSVANGGVVDLRKGCATVKDSLFRYNGFGVRFADVSETAKRSRVENCQFLNNYAKQQYSTSPQMSGTGGVVARDNSLVDIVGCTFFRCVYKEGNLNDGQNAAGAVSISSTGPSGSSSVISNCLFQANATDNTYGNSACVQAGQRNLLEIIGCTFVSNLFRTGNSGYSSSPCVAVRNTSARLIVRDSYFTDNALTNSAAASGDVPHGSVLSHTSGQPVTFINCTLERNRVDMPNYTGTCGPATLCVPRSSKFALVNCTLADNDVFGSEGRRLAEVGRDTVYNSSDLNIVNTVMTHDAPDYLPFIEGFQSQRGTILATSVIKNFTWGEDVSKYSTGCTDYGFLLTPVKPTTEVEMTLTALKRQGYAAARGLCPGATRWVQKGGTPVYRGTDDRFYVYNPTSPATKEKPWWCLDQHQGKFSDAQMEAVGITRGVSPVVSDAFGAARSAKKLALGPLNVVPGLMLLVR